VYAQAAFYPQIRLTGSCWTGQQRSDVADFSPGSSLFFRAKHLDSDPQTAAASRPTARAAQAGFDEAQANFQQKFLIALREVDDALSEIAHRRTMAQAQQQAITAASRAARVARLRYEKERRATSRSPIPSARNLAAERALAQTRSAMSIATVQLVKSLGGGWDSPESLGQPRTPETIQKV
jgi:multidrug efflux system outer membrane protein